MSNLKWSLSTPIHYTWEEHEAIAQEWFCVLKSFLGVFSTSTQNFPSHDSSWILFQQCGEGTAYCERCHLWAGGPERKPAVYFLELPQCGLWPGSVSRNKPLLFLHCFRYGVSAQQQKATQDSNQLVNAQHLAHLILVAILLPYLPKC